MQRRYSLARLTLASILVLGLTPLMAVVDAQAQIAFMSDRDGNPEIFVMDSNGKNQHRLINNPNGDWSPSWSSAGKRIAFISDRDRHPDVIPGWFTSEIYLMDADGGNPQNLTNNPHDECCPSWFNSPFSVSPVGKKFTI